MYDKRNWWNNWFVFSDKRAIAMCTKEIDADTIIAALNIAETGNTSTNTQSTKLDCDGCGNPLDESNHMVLCSDCRSMVAD